MTFKRFYISSLVVPFILCPLTVFSQIFVDITQSAGVDYVHVVDSGDFVAVGTGVAWADYDNDGDLDVYATNNFGANHLFQNNGDETFTDVGVSAGVDDPDSRGDGCVFADYDNDGDPDLYVLNFGANKLFKNNGDGSFSDITDVATVGDTGRGTTAAWGDFDLDGDLDLYVANHQSNTGYPFDKNDPRNNDALYRNDSNDQFTLVRSFLDGEGYTGAGHGVSWFDFDNDGDLDIYVANEEAAMSDESCVLWRNDGSDGAGGWIFTDISTAAGVDLVGAPMGIGVGDFNRDGHLDFGLSERGCNHLYKNNANATFSDIAAVAGVQRCTVDGFNNGTWGLVFFDYDNDGWQDLYYVAGRKGQGGGQPNSLFHNEGDETFTDVSDGSGAEDNGVGRTVAMADFNDDGLVDLFLLNFGEGPVFLKNVSANGNHWLKVKPVGSTSNRDGIGARVRIVSSGGVQYYEIKSGSSHGAGNQIIAHFGLGSDTIIDTLEVHFLGGTVQTLVDVSADQTVIVNESETGLQAPTGLTATHGGTQIELDWSEVAGASSYNVYRGTTAYFDISSSSPIASPVASNYDDIDEDGSNNVIGDPDNNYFYAVTATSPETAPSNRVGEFDFALDAGFNFVTLPLLTSGLSDAQNLGESIDSQVGGDGADAIYRMTGGSWQLMAFKSGSTWILTVTDALVVGEAYLVNMNIGGTWTIVGDLEPDLTNNLDVDFNAIMLPFQKAGDEAIMDARDLGESIDAAASGDGADAIYRMMNGSWELMAFKLSGSWVLTVTDPVVAGHAYLVNMESSGDW